MDGHLTFQVEKNLKGYRNAMDIPSILFCGFTGIPVHFLNTEQGCKKFEVGLPLLLTNLIQSCLPHLTAEGRELNGGVGGRASIEVKAL